jgi:hypothetical protein
MFSNENIIKIKIENKEYSAIAFSDKNCELPSFLLQGEKKPGYLYTNGKLEPWYWEGFSNYNDKKCLYFEPIELYPLSQLASSLRNKAPKLILNLAKALNLCDSKFLDLQNGIISAWRIFFTKDDEVLILPRNLSDIFSSTSSEKVRFNNSNSFIHANILPSFTLIDQMAQLYYFAMTSIKPFEYDTIRTNHYKAINLELLVKALQVNVDPDLVDKINKILHLSLSKTRDISANYNPEVALKWFIERFDNITWDLENIEDRTITIDDLKNNEVTKPVVLKLQKTEKRIVFWRKRGTIIIISTIVAAFVIGFVGSRINEALQPPYTAGFDQSGIITAYYQAQNDLNVQNLEASFKRGVKSPISNEITTLYVTRQTRLAYERVDSVINPELWVAEGMPPIDSKKIIYGIDETEITKLNENQYLATSIFYSPYDLGSSENEEESIETTDSTIFKCYRYEQKQVFSFSYNNRGWYEISDIQTTDFKYIDTLYVPVYNTSDTTYDIETDTRVTTSDVEEQYKNKSFLE